MVSLLKAPVVVLDRVLVALWADLQLESLLAVRSPYLLHREWIVCALQGEEGAPVLLKPYYYVFALCKLKLKPPNNQATFGRQLPSRAELEDKGRCLKDRVEDPKSYTLRFVIYRVLATRPVKFESSCKRSS